MKTTFFFALAGIAGLSVLAGCETNKTASNSRPYYIGIAPREAEKAPAPAPAPKAEPAKPMMSPLAANELAFPTGDKATSAILLRQRAPSSVKANSEYDINLDVINLTGGTLQNVVVTAESLLLSATGAFVGLGLFRLSFPALKEGLLSSPMAGFAAGLQLFPEVLATGIAVTLVVGLVAGIVPAIRSARRSIPDGLRQVS